jgi:protein-S-isoprenylcysteine O-methyltransferase Ste14
MYRFLLLVLIGESIIVASAFTATFSRRWGARRGEQVTAILRNLIGIPLWFLGFVLAWRVPGDFLFDPTPTTWSVALLLIIAGSIPVIWGHLQLGLRTHMPSVKDTLVTRGLYAYLRHPIYAGGILIFAGLALIKPTSSVLMACGAGVIWLFAQARAEEIDLLQRIPRYRKYMQDVPRFIPWSWGTSPMAVSLFYAALLLVFYSSATLWRDIIQSDGKMFLFVIPLLLGFGFVGASAFTAAYSSGWGERRGAAITSLLRNYFGIPLVVFGFILAWFQPAPFLFVSGRFGESFGWLLILAGLVPFVWGHLVLGRPTGWPSVRDPLVCHSVYAYVRHPIHAGGFLMIVGALFLKPTSTVAVACALGFVWLLIQTRLEEIDLLQRIPEYRKYMRQVPRFVPRLWRSYHEYKRTTV